MPPRFFTFAVAIVYTTYAVVGLTLPYLHDAGHPGHAPLAVGLLPLSPAHNLVHLMIGLGAFLAGANVAAATSLARGLVLVLGFTAVVGLLPPHAGAAASSSLGLISTDGIWLHAVTALLAAYVGFAPPARPRKRVVGAATAV